MFACTRIRLLVIPAGGGDISAEVKMKSEVALRGIGKILFRAGYSFFVYVKGGYCYGITTLCYGANF